MRPVAEPGELEGAVEGARREAESAFGDPTVFLERYLQRPRHIEIQLLADTHGTTVSLGERECSVQRRHQKVLEESPSVAVGTELRERLGAAAVAAAEAVGYVGAGTVEFMLDQSSGRDEFFFLEMNTRLQVEHPVTEMVYGVDLVAEQLRIADGRAAFAMRLASPRSTVTRSRSASTPRTRPPASSRRPARSSGSAIPGRRAVRGARGPARPGRRCASTPASRTARSSAPTTTRCSPR